MVSPERHSKAMDKINALVGVRERSVFETRNRLAKAGFTAEEVEDAVAAAVRVNLVSDERYARAYIRGKVHKGWGRKKIEHALMQNGIDAPVIQACADEFSSTEDEYASALRELGKRRASSKDPYATYMRRLIGRGFSYDIASRAVKEHMAALDCS